MKIAIIGSKGIPSKEGGIERYCEELLPDIADKGNSIDLYARSSYIKRSWFSLYRYKGIRVVCLPSFPIKGIDAFTNSMLAAIIANVKGYDVIHFHALGPALFCFIPKLFSSAKIIVTCHGLDWQRAKWNRFARYIIRLGEKVAVIHSHELIVVSQYLQTYFYQTYGKKTNYIPTAPTEFAPLSSNQSYTKSLELEEGKYILFLGRLVPEKRPDLLIEAFKLANSKGWKLVVAGSINPTDRFTLELIKSKGNNQNIIFTNELQGSRLTEIVSLAGLFVLPSDLEGLPLAMLEAMKKGVPVIGSDIAPHRQLIGSDKGLLFEAGNLSSLTDCIEQAISEPLKLKKMADKAQLHVEKYYRWDRISYENLKLYSKLSGIVQSKTKQKIYSNP